MTRSSGPGRQPGRPFKDEQNRDALEPDPAEGNAENSRSARRAPTRRASKGGAGIDSAPSTYTAIDPKKRGIALIIDVMVAFLLSLVLLPIVTTIGMVLPFVKVFTQPLVMMVFMLFRDWLYQGHGLGKNLMGLKVVDAATGGPPSIKQSIMRNILFFLPLLVVSLMTGLRFLPWGNVSHAVGEIVNIICQVYVLALLPCELWFVFKRADGRRLGERIADTAIVESDMDFSKAF